MLIRFYVNLFSLVTTFFDFRLAQNTRNWSNMVAITFFNKYLVKCLRQLQRRSYLYEFQILFFMNLYYLYPELVSIFDYIRWASKLKIRRGATLEHLYIIWFYYLRWFIISFFMFFPHKFFLCYNTVVIYIYFILVQQTLQIIFI